MELSDLEREQWYFNPDEREYDVLVDDGLPAALSKKTVAKIEKLLKGLRPNPQHTPFELGVMSRTAAADADGKKNMTRENE